MIIVLIPKLGYYSSRNGGMEELELLVCLKSKLIAQNLVTKKDLSPSETSSLISFRHGKHKIPRACNSVSSRVLKQQETLSMMFGCARNLNRISLRFLRRIERTQNLLWKTLQGSSYIKRVKSSKLKT